MAIAIDSSSSSGAWNGTESSVTWSHTVSGSNPVLTVFVSHYSQTVSSVTYNGVALTHDKSVTTDFSTFLDSYYLINPPSGTHNIVVTFSGATYVRTAAISLTAAKQSAQPNASTTATGDTTPVVMALTTTERSILVAGVYSADTVGTASTGATLQTAGGQELTTFSSSSVLSAGSNSMTATFGGSRAQTYIVMAIEEAAGTTYTETYTETATATASLIKLGTHLLTEAITNSDTFIHLSTFTRTLTETVTSAASLLKTAGKVLLEAITSTDLFTNGHRVVLFGSYAGGTFSSQFAAGSTTKYAGLFRPASPVTLDSCTWNIAKAGTPTGTIVASIYAVTGTPGSNAIPTGSPLATSDSISVSVPTISYNDIPFMFSGTNRISLAASTTYAVSIEPSDAAVANSSNSIYVSFASASLPSIAENLAFISGAWSDTGNVTSNNFAVYGIISGSAWVQTLTEAVSSTDTFIRSIGRTITELITDADALVRTVGRTLSDSFTNTATFLSNIGYFKTLTDTTTLLGAFIGNIGSRIFTETVTYTASLIRSTGRLFAEAITSTTSVIKTNGRTLADSFSNSDTFASLKAIGTVCTEAITYTDALLRTFTRAFIEAVTNTSTATGFKGTSPVLTEAFTAAATMSRTATRVLTDTISAAASLIRSIGRSLAESVTNTDVFTGTSSFIKSFTELFSASESLLRTTTRTLLETIVAADLFSSARVYIRTLTESVTDTASLVRARTRTLLETLTATDSFARVLAFSRVLTELSVFTVTIRKARNGVTVFWTHVAKSTDAVWTHVAKSTDAVWTTTQKAAGAAWTHIIKN